MDIENMPHNWMTPIIQYLTNNSLPNNPDSAKKIRIHVAKYLLLGKDLYRRGVSTPMLKCLDDDQTSYVMREIYEGVCGTHLGERTMAAKILRAGYYWPTLAQDCHTFVKKCIPCQQHGPHLRQHANILHPISSPWPFAIWSMDLSPFSLVKGQYRRFNEFLEGLHIKHRVTSVEHPQTNGQAEVANKVILCELKRRLGSAKGEWAEKLPEIGEPSFRRENFEESANGYSLAVNLDLLDEVRGQAAIMTEASRRMMARKFNSKINPRQFYENDLV
ncbi:uncharacterized protein LOC113869262 [Abrus precatorius]|uniref:Uncharacterized protein LOC113869262 n=1 Tax=Abrus precatorius TaxID=3816 RepID=A0A8B8LY56_ABRPR|nr:uncharacterized protein LOC113869262 [Abrus precatorius]